MIRPDDLRAKLREQPFRPFRVVTSSGRIFEIDRPDAVMVLASIVVIGEFLPNRPDVAERATQIPMNEVADLQQVPIDPYLH